MGKVLVVVIVSALLFQGAGCALMDNEITLDHSPRPESATMTRGAVEVNATMESAGFARNKQGRLVIGEVRNTYGAKTADILTKDSPADWLRAAVIADLRSRGFDASPWPANRAGGRVNVELISVGNQTEINFWTGGDQVTIRAKFQALDGESVRGAFESVARSDIRTMIASETTKQAAYRSAMDLLMLDAGPRLEEILATIPHSSRP
jgi:hypothetical protein